jgi:aspartate racemase
VKRIGIIGGLGPEATIDYYRIIVNEYREKTDGQYPVIIIYSVNMSEFVVCKMHIESSDKIMKWLAHAIAAVHQSGADFALIASNTPHIIFEDLQRHSPIPLISIVEETCKVAYDVGLKRVALLGTKVTMSSHFYQRVFSKKGIDIITPHDTEKDYINEKLFTEIMHDNIVDETRENLLKIVKRMIDEDKIQGVILGCTELPLILTKDEFGIPFLNTAKIHAKSAVQYSLEGNASLKTR